MEARSLPIRTALDVYADALVHGGPLLARSPGGAGLPLPLRRWTGCAGDVDGRVLARARGPVLDAGCGPGRHLRWLAEHGVPALGIDVCAVAVRLVRANGDHALTASIFDRVPAARTWRTVLLLDGNIGIGGRPIALLRRCGALLAADGAVLAELDPHERGVRREPLRLEDVRGASAWFPWAHVGADALRGVAASAGLAVRRRWSDGGRCFAELGRVER